MQKKNFQILIGILIIMVLFVPKVFIIDRVALQWLFLAVINLGALSYNLFLVFKGKLKHALNFYGIYNRRPIVDATSTILQEKAHSLSYQAKTRTVCFPTTLV